MGNINECGINSLSKALSMNILGKKKETSTVIQAPTNIKSENQKNNYDPKFSSRKNTLNESSELRAKLTKYLKEYKHKTDKNTNIKKKFIEMKSLK